MRRLLSIAALCLLALPAVSADWYDASWPYRIKLTVDATYVDEDTGYAFFDMSTFGTDFWTNVQGEGDSRATTSDEITECAIHIIGFTDSGTTGQGWMRVALTTSASADTDVYVYYGNSGASLPSAGDTYGYNNAYDSDVAAAYAFDGGSLEDVTGNGNTLTNAGSATTTEGPFTGLTSYGLNGTSQYLYTSDSTIPDAFVSAGEYSVFAWGYVTGAMTTDKRYIVTSNATQPQTIMWMDTDGAGDGWAVAQRNSVGTTFSTGTDSTNASALTWYALGLCWDGTDIYDYVNGVSTNSVAITSIYDVSTTGRLYLGHMPSTSQYASARYSLIEVHTTARSGDYYATAYNYMANQGSMVTVGSQESIPGSGQTGFVEFASVSTSALGGAVNWTNAINILTSLVSAMTANVPDGEYTYVADVVNPSANISGLLTYITRIDIRVTATGEDGSHQELYDDTVQLIVGGSTYGANKADATQWTDTSQVVKTYTWSPANGDTMPTPAQVDASDFGVRLRYYSSGGDDALMSVYIVELDVYSEDPASVGHPWFYLRRN